MRRESLELELFEEFMSAFHSISSKSYSTTISNLKDADAVVVLGSRLSAEEPEIFEAVRAASLENSAKILYAHPIEDVAVQSFVTQFMKYEPGSEEGVLALFAYHLLKDAAVDTKLSDFLKELDLGYLEAESSVGEEEFLEILEQFLGAKRKIFVLGSDLLAHPRANNIAKIAALIDANSDFSLLVLPDLKESLKTFSKAKTDESLEDVAGLPEFNGSIIYNIRSNSDAETSLLGSAQFARAAKISDGDRVRVVFGTQSIKRVFKIDETLKGTIAINPTFDITVDPKRYKFERAQIDKINQNSESNNE